MTEFEVVFRVSYIAFRFVLFWNSGFCGLLYPTERGNDRFGIDCPTICVCRYQYGLL